jgi:autotransporter-associated beta strand protein
MVPALVKACCEQLEDRRLLAADVWSGAGVNTLFSNPANWVGGVAPIAGQDVTFPAGVTLTLVTVSAPVTVGTVEFDAAYTLSGASAIMLDGNINATSGASVIGNPIVLGQSTIATVFDPAALTLNRISGTGFGFDKEGNGLLTLQGAGDTYTGATTVGAGTVTDLAPLTSAVNIAAGAIFNGSGSATALTATGATIHIVDGAAAGTETVNDNLTFTANTSDSVSFDLAAAASSQIVVNGGLISLGSATLVTTALASYDPAFGTVITLIQNNTGNPISGTFAGLPQGSVITVGTESYQLSYAGGTSANCVTLTAEAAADEVILTTSKSPVYEGHTIALTATLNGTDLANDAFTGTVTFYANFVPVGAAVVSDNFATFAATNLPVGTDTITATYNGDPHYATVTSSPVLVNVRAGTLPQITYGFGATTTAATTRGYTISAIVVATDVAPAGADGLTYYWSTIHLPTGAPKPVFNTNNSNLASDVTVRFAKDGGYVLQCKVQNQAGNSVTTDVTVTVTQKATSMRIVPHSAQIQPHKSQQYTVTVLDQFNHPMRNAQPLTYAVISGSASGSISSTGLFSATAVAGPATIEVLDNKLIGTVGVTVA